MEQAELRQWENRCIQEEPPPCTAACPLHVDARAVVGHASGGRWADALKILYKTMPVAGILGRICDAPCRLACNRKDVGEAIRIGDLERACLQRAGGPRRVMPLPTKNIAVAVVGSGLSSLTVAWDLVRKGYGVTIIEPTERIGTALLNRYQPMLSAEILSMETDLLAHLGVGVETLAEIGSAETCGRCLDAYAAVYVGLDAVSAKPWGIGSEAEPDRNRFSGSTGREGLFAGGDHPSIVWQAAQGRWAATSMDRWLQSVSMTAGREKEGPFETRLFTDLQGVGPLPAVAMADESIGFSDAEAMEEAGRCMQCQCLECVKVCAYLDHFGSYPKIYAREIYNNASLVLGERKANLMINSCSLCGLCEAVCPNDFAMQDLCLAARQSMVARDKMPPSAHDFALQDMAFSQSDCFAMARHAPGTTTSRYLFFPGCQLCASSPGQVRLVYDHLRNTLPGGVALMLGCCGAPAHWAGRQETFSTELARWKETWAGLGHPRPIMACATCLRVFKDHLPEADVTSLWETLEAIGIPTSDIHFPNAPLAVHDPCTTRGEPAVQNTVRRLLSRLGVETEELVLGREKTECCGFGGLLQNANPALAREVADRRSRRSDSDYLAYCAMCRDNLAAVGKRAVHLLDLMFPDPGIADPAGRPRPGWSRRRENRTRLKEDLCRDLWDEQPAAAAASQKIVLQISPAVETILESRRILEADVRSVIAHAENGGTRFCHGDTGQFLAVFRPRHVTFWVAYSPVADGFSVHNAYAHRMEVLGP